LKYRAILRLSFDDLSEILQLPDDIGMTDSVIVDAKTRSIDIGIQSLNPQKTDSGQVLLYESAPCSQIAYIYWKNFHTALKQLLWEKNVAGSFVRCKTLKQGKN
jgi:hypothetical protein